MDEHADILTNERRNSAIEARGLVKRFGDAEAVTGLDFDVFEGELFGFLGPNGAGKTTTIKILAGLARPDSGRIRIGGAGCGDDPRAARRVIGVVPDENNLYPELTGFENLVFCASLYGMRRRARRERAAELLSMFNLKQAAHGKFGGYSKGMKRKLTIAAGIVHRPRILFLDEPTAGIDASSARQIRGLIARLHGEGTTVFLATRSIEEAERLCERIAFIVDGRVKRIDTVENLLQPLHRKHVIQISCSTLLDDVRRSLPETCPETTFACLEQGRVRAESPAPICVGELVRHLEEREVEVYEARKSIPSLEDVFVEITGIEAGEMA